MNSMTNPAEDLYQILSEWKSESLQRTSQNRDKHVHQSRNLSNRGDSAKEGWEKQRYAAQCLQAISIILKEMEKSGRDVSNELQFFNEWTKSVFAYPGGFEKHGSGLTDMALSTLGMFRNSVLGFIPELDDSAVSELQNLLEDEPTLEPPEGEFPAELYDYFIRVRSHLRHCLENYESLSQFDIREAAEHYRAAVLMMTNTGIVADVKSWAAYATKICAVRIIKKAGDLMLDEGLKHLAKSAFQLALPPGAGD